MSDIYTYKIFTDSGITKKEIFNNKKVLHLGCGSKKLKNAIGIDILKFPNVDIVHNLDIVPWPIKENSVDVIYAHSFLEHVNDTINFFNECHRVSKNGAHIIIAVPYFRSVDAFSDPTHKHFFTHNSLDYFIDGSNSLSDYEYTRNKFKKVGFWYGWPTHSKNIIIKIFKNFIYKHSHFYDQYLSILIPLKIIIWELEVKK